MVNFEWIWNFSAVDSTVYETQEQKNEQSRK
jgi:hypothetical protein